MNLLRITLISFLLTTTSAYAQDFKEAIKNKYFHVQASKHNLEELHQTSTLVIGCVDFRLRDEITRFLKERLFLLDDYNELTLPGASLAFVQTKMESWSKTIEETVSVLKDLHNIKQIIFIDHMKCGAYKVIKGQSVMESSETELAAHKATLAEARKKMNQQFPDLKVYCFLMDLDGNVEQIVE